jgi:hypothetical protein
MDTRNDRKQAIYDQLQHLGDLRAACLITDSSYRSLSSPLRLELIELDRQRDARNMLAGQVGPTGATCYLCHWHFNKSPYVNHSVSRTQGIDRTSGGVQ